MSTYAEIKDGIVINVIVIDPIELASRMAGNPNTYIETFPGVRGGVHYDEWGNPSGLEAKGGNYASIGDTYDAVNGVFYRQTPHKGWVLNQSTWTWESPIPYPEDGKKYLWDDTKARWKEMATTIVSPEPARTFTGTGTTST